MAGPSQRTSDASEGSEGSVTRPVDAQALRRGRQRLHAAAEAPWLHGEAARRMAGRLGLIRQAPERVIDWWPALGGSSVALREALPKARFVGAVPSDAAASTGPTAPGADEGWTARGARWWNRLRGNEWVEAAALAPRSANLLWSNMALHWSADPPALLSRWRELVAVDGFLMFSTLGPGTLESLRELYREAGWGPPMAPLVDMHDLGDMLVAAGYADPVMDQETLRLTWAEPERALAELRTLGINADPQRFAGLRTPRWRRGLLEALDARRDASGRIALEFELVYGHAFCPLPKPRVAAQTSIAASDFQALARAGRGRDRPQGS